MRPRPSALLLLTLLLGCSDDGGTGPSGFDTTPPSSVQDLTAVASGEDRVTLTWTAPGDDGDTGRAAAYDLRYAQVEITEASWAGATRISGVAEPDTAGVEESFTLRNLSSDVTYYFALKTADERVNWSGLSNLASASPLADTEPPGKVDDLAVDSKTGRRVTLTWSAPGDNGFEGRAAEYDLRYALTEITEETWPDATPLTGLPAPASSHETELFTVTGLEPLTTYHFALRAADEVENWSELSNVLEVETASYWQLTTGGGTGPSWSPDGSQIVFSAYGEGNFDLYMIAASGGPALRLTDHPALDRAPAWSPLGDRIAFISDRGGEDRELYVMDAVAGAEPELVAGHAGEEIYSLTWSPDGSQIAYQVPFGGVIFSPNDIYVVSSSGGEPELLIEGGQDWGNWYPDWSPDGNSMAIMSTRDFQWGIWVVPLDGGEWLELAGGPGLTQNTRPSWSPAGDHIVYSSNRLDTYDIWIVDAGGGEADPLIVKPARNTSPAWSPDGSRIAFVSDQSGTSEIWLKLME
ncbi:MAG: hypothetical protein GF355_07310 [Candidatus Eisenbacteria bacterium]|nr:hypothetical protein [Candidatus Eisenbacteria bacterium]